MPNLLCLRAPLLNMIVVQISKDILQKCLGELVAEAILAQPSVVKGSLVECPCCANFPRHPAQSALETWLLTPSLPNLLCLRAPLLNMIVVQIPKEILQQMPWRLGC